MKNSHTIKRKFKIDFTNFLHCLMIFVIKLRFKMNSPSKKYNFPKTYLIFLILKLLLSGELIFAFKRMNYCIIYNCLLYVNYYYFFY